MSKSVIISGPPAVGKTTVAVALAKEFDLTYLSGGDVLKEMARDEGYAGVGDDWWDRPEGMEFLQKRAENPAFDKRVDEKLIELFNEGGKVITSYTLPWLVKNGIKIWLSGSHQSSASRMQTRDNISTQEAMDVTKKRYDKNKALYKKLYNFDFGEDLSVFDKLINTNEMDADQVIMEAKKTVQDLQ